MGQSMYTLGNQSTGLTDWVQQVQKGGYCDTYLTGIATNNLGG